MSTIPKRICVCRGFFHPSAGAICSRFLARKERNWDCSLLSNHGPSKCTGRRRVSKNGVSVPYCRDAQRRAVFPFLLLLFHTQYNVIGPPSFHGSSGVHVVCMCVATKVTCTFLYLSPNLLKEGDLGQIPLAFEGRILHPLQRQPALGVIDGQHNSTGRESFDPPGRRLA
jgi:hypothetical protein